MKVIAINFSILWASKVDVMIVNRAMPRNKKPKAMKLLAKKLEKTKKIRSMFQSFRK
jgi:hypothetical protein